MPNFLHVANGTTPSGAFWSFGLRSSGSISEAAAETAWGGGLAAYFATAGVQALYSTGFHYTKSSTSTASSLWKQTTITRTSRAGVGTAATAELPDHDALVVTYRAATADKSSHGRWFMPAPVAAALAAGTGGHLSAASVTTLTGALATFRNSLVTAGLTPVILTRHSTKSGLFPDTTKAVATWELVSTLGVQNRRGDKLVPTRTTF